MSKMFVPRIPGYRTKTIVVDDQPFQIQVPITIKKAKAFEVVCSAAGHPPVPFVMDGANATSRGKAVQVASDRYRYVEALKANVHVNVTVTPILAQIGATA